MSEARRRLLGSIEVKTEQVQVGWLTILSWNMQDAPLVLNETLSTAPMLWYHFAALSRRKQATQHSRANGLARPSAVMHHLTCKGEILESCHWIIVAADCYVGRQAPLLNSQSTRKASASSALKFSTTTAILSVSYVQLAIVL